MARTLHLFVWIYVLNMCLCHRPPFPPFWGWRRHYDTVYTNWQATAFGYKYPAVPLQVGQDPHILLPIFYNQENFRTNPDCTKNARSPQETHGSRMNERSIIPGNVHRDDTKAYPLEVEESVRRSENGTSKILNVGTVKSGSRRGQVDNSQITFPGPSVRSDFSPVIPDSCQSSTFCENVPGYPEEAINELLNELGNSVSFSVDRLDKPDFPDITQRVGSFEETLALCSSDEKVVYPQSVKSTDGKWYTLVNRKDNPVQGFRVEICDQAVVNKSCSDIAYFRRGYEGACVQKYFLRTATVVETDQATNKPKTTEIEVKMPSCCSCIGRTLK